MELVDVIARSEGFNQKPKPCPNGVLTIGHGITFITVDESLAVVELKLAKLRKTLYYSICGLSHNRQDVLIDMAYNLGVSGLFGFKRMWLAIYRNDFEAAAREMLDSVWAGEVKGRALSLADKMRVG